MLLLNEGDERKTRKTIYRHFEMIIPDLRAIGGNTVTVKEPKKKYGKKNHIRAMTLNAARR